MFIYNIRRLTHIEENDATSTPAISPHFSRGVTIVPIDAPQPTSTITTIRQVADQFVLSVLNGQTRGRDSPQQ